MQNQQNNAAESAEWLAESVKMLEQRTGLTVIPCPRCNNPRIAQYVCRHCSEELGFSDSDIDALAGDYAGTLHGEP